MVPSRAAAAAAAVPAAWQTFGQRISVPTPIVLSQLQVLVEAELPDGEPCSVLLQNAETVRLVGPVPGASGSSGGGGGSRASQAGGAAGAQSAAAAEDGYVWQQGGSGGGGGGDASGSRDSWRAISVSELAPGDRVFVLRQGGARHTGVAIEESITER